MMYNNKLVSAVRVRDISLREEGEIVRLPFGTEYSLFFKNLNYTQRCVLNIDIDGTSITCGGLVLDAGKTAILEHPVGDQRRFKFIERTSGIENFRGINPEDGLVVIKFQFEKASLPPLRNYYSSEVYYGVSPEASSIFCSSNLTTRSINQVGVTGHGSVSGQQFGTTRIHSLEPQIYTTVFRLLGVVNDTDEKYKLVSKPIDVKVKKVCSMCGRSFKSTVSYCPDDGNALEYKNIAYR